MNTKIEGITVSHTNETAVWGSYKKNVLDKAQKTLGDADLSYIEEDLRSPCTLSCCIQCLCRDSSKGLQ